MPTDNPFKVSPLLLDHIDWVRARLEDHRKDCEARAWHDCQLRDVSPREGLVDPVHLGCAACEVQMVMFKKNQSLEG
jgi:hypothetical protein